MTDNKTSYKEYIAMLESRIEKLELFRDVVGEWLYDSSKRQPVFEAYLATSLEDGA